MTENAYRDAIDAAIQELSELMKKEEELREELEQVEERTSRLRLAVYAMSEVSGIPAEYERPELFPEFIAADTGFTDAIRQVIVNTYPQFVTPVSLRDALQKRGFDIAKYSNPLASIHTILKRLRDKGEVEEHADDTGKMMYLWGKKGKRTD
jgi:hypothetical protein